MLPVTLCMICVLSEFIGSGIVGSVNQDDMDQPHSYHQRDNAPENDFVLSEQSLRPYPSSKCANENGGQSEDGTPPRHE